MSFEEFFLSKLPFVERTVSSLARQCRLSEPDAEDLLSTVNMKLIADDYAVLRKFQGKSQLDTYLYTVIANTLRDFRVRQWGKWRPSAAAKRLGPVAELLDQLLSRDGHDIQEAIRILVINHRVEETPEELEKMAAQLPRRSARRLENESRMPEVEAADRADDGLRDEERRTRQDALEAALERALGELPAEDRVILKMRFWDDFKIKAIASALSLPQRPLYRRVERLIGGLRDTLEKTGVSAGQVTELFAVNRQKFGVHVRPTTWREDVEG